MKQLTRKEAIAFDKNKEWQKWDAKTRALFQLKQNLLCMPLEDFREALEEVLGRVVFLDEFIPDKTKILAELRNKI